MVLHSASQPAHINGPLALAVDVKSTNSHTLLPPSEASLRSVIHSSALVTSDDVRLLRENAFIVHSSYSVLSEFAAMSKHAFLQSRPTRDPPAPPSATPSPPVPSPTSPASLNHSASDVAFSPSELPNSLLGSIPSSLADEDEAWLNDRSPIPDPLPDSTGFPTPLAKSEQLLVMAETLESLSKASAPQTTST